MSAANECIEESHVDNESVVIQPTDRMRGQGRAAVPTE